MIYLLIFAIFYFVFVKTIICLVHTVVPDYSSKYPPRRMNKKLGQPRRRAAKPPRAPRRHATS